MAFHYNFNIVVELLSIYFLYNRILLNQFVQPKKNVWRTLNKLNHYAFSDNFNETIVIYPSNQYVSNKENVFSGDVLLKVSFKTFNRMFLHYIQFKSLIVFQIKL